MMFIDEIVKHILRPLREHYRIGRLGPKQFSVFSSVSMKALNIERTDEIVINNFGRRIHYSMFNIRNESHGSRPVVIYLHANNGCRLEGMTYLQQLLKNEFNVVLVDFTGSGLSDGDYISLGVRESEDLDAVIENIVKTTPIKDLFLWGRSMGAVTALLFASYGKHRGLLRGCIYDSPFRSLKRLIKELASEKTGLPQFFFTPFIPLVNARIKELCGWELIDLKLKRFIGNIRVPGMFITSKNDRMVNSEHVEKLHGAYTSLKKLEYINEQHHEGRPGHLIEKCLVFFKMCLATNDSHLTSKRKLHSIFFENHQTQKISSETSIEPLLPSSIFNKPGKVSVTSLKKLMEQGRQSNKSIFHQADPIDAMDKRIMTPKERVMNNLIVQPHRRNIAQFNTRGINVMSKKDF